MAKKTLLVGSVLAAALLAGCSGTSNGGNSSASTSSSTSSSSSVASSSAPSVATESSDEAVATSEDSAMTESSGSVEPATLDAQSTAWFSTMCKGFSGAATGMMSAMGGMSAVSAATDPAATKDTLVTAFQATAQAFTDTSAELSDLPAPTIDNGEKFATDFVTAFDSIGAALGATTDKLAATPVTDQASLAAALTTFQTDAENATQGLQTQFGGLQEAMDPSITAAVEALPECKILSGL